MTAARSSDDFLALDAYSGDARASGSDEPSGSWEFLPSLNRDGSIARFGERIPLVNNMFQCGYSLAGDQQALARSQERNPLGHAGYVTQVAEHVPVVADAIQCYHQYVGHEDDAERARAYSLRKLVGEHGALTKLAELIPGTNLVAAAMHEMSGDHEAAMRAIDWIGQVRDVASPDGPLARLAELLPVTDAVAFGFYVNRGEYALALRAICKTRWVEIKSSNSALLLSMGNVKHWEVLDVDSDLEVQPVAYSIPAVLMDLFILLLDFNRDGSPRIHVQRRRRTTRSSSGSVVLPVTDGRGGSVRDVMIAEANSALSGVQDYLTEKTPEYIEYCTELMNWSMYEWDPATRTSKYTMWCISFFLPPMPFVRQAPYKAPSAGAALANSIRDSLANVQAEHKPMPLQDAVIPQHKRRRSYTEAAAAVSCISFVGCGVGVAVHLGPVIAVPCCAAGLLSGCAAGFSAVHRYAKKNLIPLLNFNNKYVLDWMSAPVVPLRRTADNLMQPWSLDPAAQELEGNPTVGADSPCMGIVFNWDQSLVESVRAAEVAREYMKYEYLTLRRPMNWLHPACVAMNVFERQLRTFLNDALEGQEVPLAIPIPTPEGWYEGTWLPEIRVMLVLWFNFNDLRYVKRVEVALVDGMLDQIANVIKPQVLPDDLRVWDPRLAGFTDTVDLKFDIALRWVAQRLRVELHNLNLKLSIPI